MTMLLFKTVTASLLVSIAAAVSVCDVVKARNATYFCEYLSSDPVLAKFNNQTSNITVLAFNDTAPGQGFRYPEKRNAVLQYHIIRGIHTSESIRNKTFQDLNDPTEKIGRKAFYTILDTHLENSSYANVTGGQKFGAEYRDRGLTFWAGGMEATGQQLDLNFDGGIIHFVDIVIDIPARAREKILQVPTIANNNAASEDSTAIFQEALYMTGLMDEIESLKDVTILAPFDRSFFQIGSIFDGMSMERLKEIMSYHIILGNVTYADAIASLSPAWTRFAPTLAGKTVNITHRSREFISRGGVLINSISTGYNDVFVANGNILVIQSVLNPNNASAIPYPNAKNVTEGTSLFANITRTSESSASVTRTTSSSTSSNSPGSTDSISAGSNATLSSGAKAGIGVGLAAGALGLLLLAGWIFRSRRRKPVAGEPEERIDPEKVIVTVGDKKDPAELDLSPPAELDGGDNVPRKELDGKQVGPELPGCEKPPKHELA